MAVKIRWQMCYMYTVPVCRFCKYNLAGELTSPLYTEKGHRELRKIVIRHMQEAHSEYEVIK